jgi:hypothetical protein
VKLTLSSNEVRELLDIPALELPKYTSTLINLANRISRGTVPKAVGQMTELVVDSKKREWSEWEAWYRERHPGTLEKATTKVLEMLQNLKQAIDGITPEMVEKWVRDLVVVKSFIGIRVQEAIIKRVAQELGYPHTPASRQDEAKNIDAYIGGKPVSVKPKTYKLQAAMPEELPETVIYYEKRGSRIVIEFEPF